MKPIIYLLILFFSFQLLHSQNFERQVVNSSGETLSNSSNSLDFSVGELVISTLTNGSVLTQGFHQGSLLLSIKINPIAFLQGAYINPNSGEETLMRDDLRVSTLIPTISPYADGLIANASVFTPTGNDAIVDWIWVELRDETDNTIIIDSQSALLQRDGDIVDVDGVSELTFNQSVGNYYIAVNHRNHLGIMTANSLVLNSNSTQIDFTDGSITTYGSNAQTNFGMPIGVQGLWTGDVNDDSVVQYSGAMPDTPEVLSFILNDAGNFLNLPTYLVTDYSNYDVDMDGQIQYTGANPEPPLILQNVLSYPANFLNLITWPIEAQLPNNIGRVMQLRTSIENSKH